MRPRIVAAALLLVAACAAPTATAAASSLAFDAPESTPANTTVPVTVSLSLSGFLCHEPHTVTVSLFANSTEGVKATFQRTTLTYTIPARSYFAESYSEAQEVNLTVRAIASGDVELAATMSADVGPCFVPNGFDSAATTATIEVEGPATTIATPTNETNATTTGNETNTTNATATPKPPTPKSSNTGKPSCGPDGGCGPIGEYDAPQESSGNGVPGVTPLLAVGILALAAFVWRGRRRSG